MLLLIGLALFLHPRCFCLVYNTHVYITYILHMYIYILHMYILPELGVTHYNCNALRNLPNHINNYLPYPYIYIQLYHCGVCATSKPSRLLVIIINTHTHTIVDKTHIHLAKSKTTTKNCLRYSSE